MLAGKTFSIFLRYVSIYVEIKLINFNPVSHYIYQSFDLQDETVSKKKLLLHFSTNPIYGFLNVFTIHTWGKMRALIIKIRTIHRWLTLLHLMSTKRLYILK